MTPNATTHATPTDVTDARPLDTEHTDVAPEPAKVREVDDRRRLMHLEGKLDQGLHKGRFRAPGLEEALLAEDTTTSESNDSSENEEPRHVEPAVGGTDAKQDARPGTTTTRGGGRGGIQLYGHRLNLFMCAYIGLNHVGALYAIGKLLCSTSSSTSPSWKTLAFAFALWPISGLGITAGAHRLWSHRTYSAHWLMRLFLMLCNSVANQGSIFHWARDHRTHHLHSDTISDPHDSNRGWFYSHVGWLLVQKPEEVRAAGRRVDVSDLLKDPMVALQKRLDPWWNFFWCFAAPAACCRLLFEGESLWNGFLYAGVLRYVYVLHCTWSVNSIVHTDFGPSPYNPRQPPSESRLVSFLAIGEGWHSWHHAFPFDYAMSELGAMDQYNPTKVFIDGMARLGLVQNRKRGLRMWGARKKMMAEKAKAEGKMLVETLSGPPFWRVRGVEYRPL